jgi:hypothetical protein
MCKMKEKDSVAGVVVGESFFFFPFSFGKM